MILLIKARVWSVFKVGDNYAKAAFLQPFKYKKIQVCHMIERCLESL